MKQSDAEKAYQEAQPLSVDDIIFTEAEQLMWRKCMLHAIMSIIVNQGGEAFQRFKTDLAKNTPQSGEVLEIRTTELYPLPSMEIDESSIKGCIEVNETIAKELEIPASSDTVPEYVRLQGGDQLTNSRNRSIQLIRLGHEVGINAWRHIVPIIGLFHVKMADAHGILETHYGKSGTGSRNPTSLWFHNTVLDRQPITLTSLPTYRTCRDLIFISLYGRIMHCLLLVSGYKTLSEYSANVDSFAQLSKHAEEIYTQFVLDDGGVIADARERRFAAESEAARDEVDVVENENETSPSVPKTGAKKVGAKTGNKGKQKSAPAPANSEAQPRAHTPVGDSVFEAAVLFNRDALISRELCNSVKCGDSGRIILSLKMLALAFRGNGRTKYAHELLHVIHNFEHVWPKPLRYVADVILSFEKIFNNMYLLNLNLNRKIILHNWLVNPTGRSNGFVEIDLMQEHLNFWIKVMSGKNPVIPLVKISYYRKSLRPTAKLILGNGFI